MIILLYKYILGQGISLELFSPLRCPTYRQKRSHSKQVLNPQVGKPSKNKLYSFWGRSLWLDGMQICIMNICYFILHIFAIKCHKASFTALLRFGETVNLLSKICGSHFHHHQSSLPSPPIHPCPTISLGDCLAAISEQQFCLCSGSVCQKKSSLLILWSVTCLGLDFLITQFNPVELCQTGVTSHIWVNGMTCLQMCLRAAAHNAGKLSSFTKVQKPGW